MFSSIEKAQSFKVQAGPAGHFLLGLSQNAAVALTYLLTAKLGFLLALDHTNATAVWPPTGVALAACLVFGLHLWPGIFLGAFLANILVVAGSSSASLPVLLLSLSTAAGNTLEALVGAYLVSRFISGRLPFDCTLDAVYFMLFGALASPLISATIGTVSFSVYGSDWSRCGQMWLTWWLGDAVGALVFAPLLLTWEKRGAFRRYRWQPAEAAALLAALLLTEIIIFHLNAPLEYLIFPLLFWTAFRFGQFETALTVTLVMATFLLWTVNGLGPFAGKPLNNALLFLQSYLGVASASTLILSTLISARNRAEDSLREYQDNLEKQVTLRTAELQGANERLTTEIEERVRAEKELAVAKERAEAADHLKSAFLATMSHELRTPLNSIIGFTGILLQGLGGPINTEQEKQLTMVKNSANHLLSLISDVLDISKIEAGQLKVVLEPFNLRDSMLKVAQAIRPLVEKKGLDLFVEVADDVGIITGDVRRVEQILLNLLSNAVKFTEHGSISVHCMLEAGNYVTNVTDTGIGIKADDLERLFQPFQQVDTGLSRKYEGTGLGLSICRKMAEMMGGSIRVESIFGTGSTFSFLLPLDRGELDVNCL
ncbi:hybrid signal transduction histidine kinase B [Geobacter sp. OR-1]|uniref:MASE1 domain-containing protein n=1 Tax=Geobacter sp. OR-1 TaxID=1266765 RepID=UPI000541F17C|nr:MASE1 domain-containing protein [Geobacter sp. OR-1]GAM10229.1 hybrid signal transduction histidine kinase B [Geobacter sp. OR-1]